MANQELESIKNSFNEFSDNIYAEKQAENDNEESTMKSDAYTLIERILDYYQAHPNELTNFKKKFLFGAIESLDGLSESGERPLYYLYCQHLHDLFNSDINDWAEEAREIIEDNYSKYDTNHFRKLLSELKKK